LFLDNRLTGEQRQAFLRHVKDCHVCREELSLAQDISVALRALGNVVEAPAGFAAGVMASLAHTGNRRSATPVRERVLRWKFAAAGVAAAAAVALGTYSADFVRMAPLPAPVPVAERSSGNAGEPVQTVTPDETAVHGEATVTSRQVPHQVALSTATGTGKPALPPATGTIPSAQAETPVFLSSDHRLLSTVTKLAVADLAVAKSRALELATASGASVEEVAAGLDGSKSYAVLRCVVPPARQDSLLASFAGLGDVLSSTTSSADQADEVERLLTQYRNALAELQMCDDSQARRMLQAEADELKARVERLDFECTQRVVVLWLTEQ
jgi:hypothetical protein